MAATVFVCPPSTPRNSIASRALPVAILLQQDSRRQSPLPVAGFAANAVEMIAVMRAWRGAVKWVDYAAGMMLLWAAQPSSCDAGQTNMGASLQPLETVEVCRVRIVNQVGGEIAVSQDAGKTWERIGSVTQPAQNVDRKAYTAAKWAKIGAVAATAVNAIHIKTDQNAEEDRGVVFSLLPKEFGQQVGAPSYVSLPSSIVTDLAAGTAIFGGRFSPFVGSPVMIEREDALSPIPAGHVPAVGDRLVIIAQQPKSYPCSMVFENRFGGLITLVNCDGTTSLIGQVLKPVVGVGRFSGALYAGIGRIRANHSGVIDVSVSPLGTIGGFQIIPSGHAMSPEMVKARTSTQWMVVGPVCVTDQSFEGLAPLFFGYLRPVYDSADLYADDWETRMLSRFLVEVKSDDGDWGPVPVFELDPNMNKPLPDWANSALENVTAFRILFPTPPADCHSESASRRTKNPTVSAPAARFNMGCFVPTRRDEA
jgi:hypothetical protein